MTPASLYKRFLAFIIDFLVVYTITYILTSVEKHNLKDPSMWDLIYFHLLYIAVFFIVYSGVSLRSSSQATIGQQIFGLKVTTWNGGRLGFFRSALRGSNLLMLCICYAYLDVYYTESTGLITVAIAACILPLLIGSRQLSLHDYIFQTIVIDSGIEKNSFLAILASFIWYYLLTLILGVLLFFTLFFILIMASGGMN